MNLLVSIPFLCTLCCLSAYASDIAADFIPQPVELEDSADIVKRQAQQTTPKPKDKNDYTSVKTKNGCKLYAREVIFIKKTAKAEQNQFDIDEVTVAGPKLERIDDGTCGNWSGTIVLNYKGPFTSEKGKTLNSLKLTFNINYSKPFSWWELGSLDVSAEGPMVDGKPFNQKFEGSVMKSVAVGASKKFSYACGAPPTLFYSMDANYQTVYGIRFRDLQIQPFIWSRKPGNFTNDVDDCVPFFSIGIWMFLIVATVLLLVVFFGIGMISSLKTMDRFDDPKGKPMVITAKE